MPNWKKVITSGSDASLNSLSINGNTVLTTENYDTRVCHLKTNIDAAIAQGSATAFDVNFNLEEHNDSSLFSHNSGVITVLSDGWYRIYANMAYDNSTDNARNTIRAYVSINGSEITSTATYDYDRGNLYGKFSNNKIETMLYLTSSDTIAISNYAYNEDGNVTIESAECEFIVNSVAVQTSATNADTVDGLHGTQFVRSDIDASLTGSFTGSFTGDGSGLTGIFSVTNETDNRIITSTGAGGGNAEANLAFNGDTLTLINSKISINDGGNSVFIGQNSGQNDDGSDNRNVGVGRETFQNNTTGQYNTAHGFRALRNNTTGTNNTANGYQALLNNTTGIRNIAIGYEALHNNTIGNYNTANGHLALNNNTTGQSNTANGALALYNLSAGSSNIANGSLAGRYISNGGINETSNDSVFIGYDTRPLNNGETNQIVIGYEARGLGSNTVTLGNDDIVTTALKGNVGIGITSPSTKLHVDGTISGSGLDISGDISGSAVSASTYYGDGSNLTGLPAGSIFAATGSFQATTNDLQITGSLDVSGSSTLLGNSTITGDVTIYGNQIISGSTVDIDSSVTIYKSGSTVFNIEGSQGQLFSITDELSGSLFSVNDISGIPILEVFSDDTIIAGAYNQNDFVITDSKIGIGKDSPTSKLDMSGSLTVTGSVKTEVVALSVTSNTASMDCTLSNSFTLDLVAGTDTYLNPTNIQPGQSLNLKITQNDTEAGTLSYGSDIKFSNTLPYTASATLEAIDIVSFASFDSTTLYASALKDFN